MPFVEREPLLCGSAAADALKVSQYSKRTTSVALQRVGLLLFPSFLAFSFSSFFLSFFRFVLYSSLPSLSRSLVALNDDDCLSCLDGLWSLRRPIHEVCAARSGFQRRWGIEPRSSERKRKETKSKTQFWSQKYPPFPTSFLFFSFLSQVVKVSINTVSELYRASAGTRNMEAYLWRVFEALERILQSIVFGRELKEVGFPKHF